MNEQDEMMVSDDLMPSDTSSVYMPPVDEVKVAATNAEKAMVQQARPMFEHIIRWFDLEIAAADSIDQLKIDSNGAPITAQIIATQQLKKKLKSARSRLEIMQHQYLD